MSEATTLNISRETRNAKNSYLLSLRVVTKLASFSIQSGTDPHPKV